MRKIFLGLLLLVSIIHPSEAKETYYCWDPELKYTYTRNITVHANPLNRCQKELQSNAIEITKNTYDKAQKIISDPSYHLWMEDGRKLAEVIANSKKENKIEKNQINNDVQKITTTINKNIKAEPSSYSCEINQHASEGRFKLKINTADADLLEKCYKEFIIKEKAKGQKAFVLIQGTAYQDEALIFSSKYNIADAKDNGYLFFISYYSFKPGYRMTNNGKLIMVNDDRVAEINKTADMPKIEKPIDNIGINNVIKSEKVSKSENEERKTNIIGNKNTKLEVSPYSKKCEGGIFSLGYKKGTKEFDECINKEQKLAALDEQKKQIINDEKNKKVKQKQELDSAKIKEDQIKLSKMKPEDRHAYTCIEKFGFRKGSDKFKDCVFELYKVETELEKIELQKQVAKANAEAARASAEAARAGADRQERLLLAQTEAAKMQALAARQQAIAANTADSMALIESGLRMMSPQRPAPRMQTNCTFNGRFMSCF